MDTFRGAHFKRGYLQVIWLCPHAFFKRTGGHGEAEVIANESDAIGARGIQIAEGALRLDDQWSRLRLHHFAVALRISDMDQHFGVTRHVEVASSDVDKLHGTVRPIG